MLGPFSSKKAASGALPSSSKKKRHKNNIMPGDSKVAMSSTESSPASSDEDRFIQTYGDLKMFQDAGTNFCQDLFDTRWQYKKIGSEGSTIDGELHFTVGGMNTWLP